MKINLDVVHSCTIKRKKPWPKVSWLGKEKQQLFLFDYQRISVLDPKTGKTKRKVSKISNLLKNVISMNLSDSKIYLIGVLNSGDIFIWNKDTDVLKYVEGVKDFAYRLGHHFPSVYISDDTNKILLVTSRNKVFLFETDYSAIFSTQIQFCSFINSTTPNQKNTIHGNWSAIVSPKDIKTVEDNKELVSSARFNSTLTEGTTATCCFVFNNDNQLVVTVLRISWINPGEIVSLGKTRYETLWTSYFPALVQHQICQKFDCINSRGAYVCKLSYSSKLLAIGINQKLVTRNSLVFLSPINGSVFQANLRNFGLNEEAKGRHYWIQELNWLYNDLYLIGITKHGAIFVVSRLGNPILIHATGNELSIGPALFITLHPLIVIKRKNDTDVASMNSLTSAAENDDPMRQRYSLSTHPYLPLFICSDGYLTCVLSFKPAFINQSRLLRELTNEATRLANSILPDKHRKLKLTKSESKLSLNSQLLKIPDWGLHTTTGTSLTGTNQDAAGNSSFEDSGVENDNNNNIASKPSITEGKIIFSYIPQVLPISFEKLETNTVASKLEALYEITQNSWNLLSSTYTNTFNKFDYEPAINTIKQLLSSYTNIFINLNYANFIDLNLVKNNNKLFKHLKQLFNDDAEEFNAVFEECKLKTLIILYLNLFKILYFDTSEYHMFIHLPKILSALVDSLLKPENLFKSIEQIRIHHSVYVFLNLIRSFLTDIYKFHVNEQLFINIDQVIEQAKMFKSQQQKLFEVELVNSKLAIISRNDEINEEINFDQLNDNSSISNQSTEISSVDYIMEHGWKCLLKHTTKYHTKLSQIKAKNFNVKSKLTDLSYLLILIERNLKSYNQIYSITKGPKIKLNNGDELYYNGNLDAALNVWKFNLNKLLMTEKQQKKCLKLAHKILYSCIANYELKKFILILNDYLTNFLATTTTNNEDSDYTDGNNNNEPFTRVNLNLNIFTKLEPPKPVFISHTAVICLLESFARFMALYFMNKTKLLVYSINNPKVLPNIIEICESKVINNDHLKIEISNQRLTNKLKNDKYLQKIFSIDKTLELLMLCGLYNEAIYFIFSINDWKSTFLLSSILKESENQLIVKQLELLPQQIQCENLLTNKLCSILNLDFAANKPIKYESEQSILFDKTQTENLNKILKDLLLCSVITKINVLSPLLRRLLDLLVLTVGQLSAIIDNSFYLPAPPIYCTQMMTANDTDSEDAKNECVLRLRLSNITKCIIQLLQSSNLHVPLIKWYLQELNTCSLQMNTNFGIQNLYFTNNQLVDLLKSIRYQKLGYIPQDVLLMFRDFCTILFYLDIRDKFSLLLRKYTKSIINNNSRNQHHVKQQEIDQTCINIIDYGNLMLSYRGFLKNQHVEIQDIILSSIARLTTSQSSQALGLALERKLAICVDKTPFSITSNGVVNNDEVSESFQSKLDSLLAKWKEIKGQYNTTLAEIYFEHVNTKRATTVKLLTMFGLPEDVLIRVYLQKLPRSQPCLVGSYDYERSHLCSEFLELFFKIGFGATETWENFVQCVNTTPLLPEFYEGIRAQHLPNGPPDKSYIMAQSPLIRRRFAATRNQTLKPKFNRSESVSITPTNIEERDQNEQMYYRGLFRKYEIKRANEQSNKLTKKSRSSSLTDLRVTSSINLNNKLRKTVSFHDIISNSPDSVISNNISLNEDVLINEISESISSAQNETADGFSTYKVLDYGSKYDQVTHLAIWLMKWTKSFNMIVNDSKITYKIQSINANMLVGSVYLADNLSYVSMLPQKPKRKTPSSKSSARQLNSNRSESQNINSEMNNLTSDELTDVTTAIPTQHQQPVSTHLNQISEVDGGLTSSFNITELNNNTNQNNVNNNNNGYNDSDSTLDISSLDEQEEMFLRRLQDNGSRNKTPSPTKQRVMIQDEYSNFTNVTETRADTNRNPEDYFRQSMSKTPQYMDTKQFSIHPQQPVSDFHFPQHTQIPEYQYNQIQQSPSLPPMMNAPITDIIRDELKKIVQLQHDTIMNVLNGNSMQPQQNFMPYPSQQMNTPFQSNMHQNLIEKLKYVSNMTNSNGEPMEFIIETKVKTAQNGPMNLEMQNKAIHIKTPVDEYDHKSSHFMKSFNYEKRQNLHAAQPSERSIETPKSVKTNPLGIPLLTVSGKKESVVVQEKSRGTPTLPFIKEAWGSIQQTEQTKSKTNFNFPLLTIKSRKERSKSPTKYDHVAPPQLVAKEKPSTVEDTVKILKNLTKQVPSVQQQNIRLLQLNQKPSVQEHEVPKVTEETAKTPRVQENKTTEKIDMIPTRESKTPVQMESKGVEAIKPLYDGYILKPGSFDEFIQKETNQFSSAEAHYNATKHIRDVPDTKPSNKKEIFTTTDDLPSANVIPPDILFKLKFDPLKKGRETQEGTLGLEKDFINVADLDSGAVQDILNLIEREQNKRSEKQIISKPKVTPHITTPFVPPTREIETEQIEPEKTEQQLKADALTEKLLKDEEQLNYELLHQNLISSHARSKSRKGVLDEFKLIDQKIKIMNDIAGDIGNDYIKYNKMVETLQDFNKIVEITHDYPIGSKEIPRDEDILKLEEQEKINERKKTKFYKKDEAHKKIEDFKQAISKPAKVEEKRPIIKRPKTPVETKPKEQSPVDSDDEDLSDLKADEEERLKKILNIEPTSVSNLIKDVFDKDNNLLDETEIDATRLDIIPSPGPKSPKKSPIVPRKTETKPKLSEKQLVELEQRKQKNKERMEAAKKRRENIIATISSKSPTRHEPKSISSTQASPRLNVTYKVPTSNLVQLEKEKAEKREAMQQQYMEARAQEAQLLLKDIIIENIKVATNKQDTTTAPISDVRRTQTKIPTLILEEPKKAPKMDLMTKTLIQLQNEEQMKKRGSEMLLHDLEERALIDDKKSREPKSSERPNVKTVKSFTHYVHLQDPEKLKHNPTNQPLTYSERLQLHQEPSTKKPSENEVFKIYGTKRVPGLYKPYVKQTPRKIKTYQDRVRELRPQTETIYIDKQKPTRIPVRIPKKRTGLDIRKGKTYAEQLRELQNKNDKTFIVKSSFKKPSVGYTQKRHDLQPKTRIEYKRDQNRFQPYASPYVDFHEAPDELSPWSMDDDMKRILYGENVAPSKKQVTYRDQDQETLADTDDYLQMFTDGPSQRDINRLLDDIDNERDYTESVNIDDLKNLVSLSTETISYVDWDQIDRLLQD